MSTASIDFTLATIAVVIIATGAIFGIDMAVEPYLSEETGNNERFYQIGRLMLLSQGEPIDWGRKSIPFKLGFASGNEPYELDIDKVTRLNPENMLAVNYSSLWEALGIDDLSFRIEVKPLFNILLYLQGTKNQGTNTTYSFITSATANGYPIPCKISYYLVHGNQTQSKTGLINSTGKGTIDFTLSNSINGTAMIIGMAKRNESMVSFGILPFTHGSGSPFIRGTYATISPLDYILEVENSKNITVWNAAVYSYNFAFNLTGHGSSYSIPHLRDTSPLILVLTGYDDSHCWVEWVSYPQVPLTVGANMSENVLLSDVVHTSYIVEVEGTLYRFDIQFRSPAGYV